MRGFWSGVSILIAFVFFSAGAAFGFAGMGASDLQGGEQAKMPALISGKVVETMNAGGYTYVQLEKGGQKVWVAVPEMKIKMGEEMVFSPGNVMPNFKSQSLGRTFDEIIFSPGPLALPGTKGDKAKKTKAASSAPSKAVKVEKASGGNAYTVFELFEKKGQLNNKEITVRGNVVKVSIGIMGKNWVHLEDGTGSAASGDNHLVVTTDDTASVGDVVTVTGKLLNDKDFGYGYKYDVLIEEATVSK